jgi:hypothetical protein
MVNWQKEIRFFIKEGTTRILQSKKERMKRVWRSDWCNEWE